MRYLLLVAAVLVAVPVLANEPLDDSIYGDRTASVTFRACTSSESRACQRQCASEPPPYHRGGNWFLTPKCVGFASGGTACYCNWSEWPDDIAMFFLPGASHYYTLKRA